MVNARKLLGMSPAGPTVSGTVAIIERAEPDPVLAIVDVIKRLAEAGNASVWAVVDNFPYMKLYHWAAYAREAGVDVPNRATRAAIRAAYIERVGYAGNGTPVEDNDP